MAKKYIENDANGDFKEIEVTVISTGSGDAGKPVGLDVDGFLHMSVFPADFGPAPNTGTVSEALSDGDFVNVWDDSGVTSVRKADASTGKPADGFILASYIVGATALVYGKGRNSHRTGLTGGVRQFLSTSTPGGVQTTAPTASGHIVQDLGKSYGTTVIDFQKGPTTRRA